MDSCNDAFKPWEQLTPDEKSSRLRLNLSRFIEHANEQNIVRNLALDALKTRVAVLEAELKRMTSRMARLER